MKSLYDLLHNVLTASIRFVSFLWGSEHLHFSVSHQRMTVNYKLCERYGGRGLFKVRYRSPGGTYVNHEKPQDSRSPDPEPYGCQTGMIISP
jgi:hypothetical protein